MPLLIMFEPPICGPTTKARTSVDAAETCKTSVKKENICRVPCTYLAYHCLAIGLCWSMLQALMGDAFLLGKALQALVTPELLPGFLVTASEFCPQQNIRAYDCHTCAFTACLRPLLMFGSYAVLYQRLGWFTGERRLFSCSLCFESPVELPKLVAKFFHSLGWGESAISADTEDAAAKLMLSLLKDMGKEMPWRWQKAHLDRVIESMVTLLPRSKTLLNQVYMLTLLCCHDVLSDELLVAWHWRVD